MQWCPTSIQSNWIQHRVIILDADICICSINKSILSAPAWPKLVTAACLCYHTSSVLSHPKLLHKQSNPYLLSWQQERCHRLFWCQSLVAVLPLDASMIGHDACNQFTTIIIYCCETMLWSITCFIVHTVFQTNLKPRMYYYSWNQWYFCTYNAWRPLFSLSVCKALPMTLITLWCHGQLISCSLHLLKFAPPTQHLVSLNVQNVPVLSPGHYACEQLQAICTILRWNLEYSSLLLRSVLGKKFPEVTNPCLSFNYCSSEI